MVRDRQATFSLFSTVAKPSTVRESSSRIRSGHQGLSPRSLSSSVPLNASLSITGKIFLKVALILVKKTYWKNKSDKKRNNFISILMIRKTCIQK